MKARSGTYADHNDAFLEECEPQGLALFEVTKH